MSKAAKLRELQHLSQLHDTSIERQQALLTKITRGKFKVAAVTDEVLFALAKGELGLLKRRKEEIDNQISELEKPKATGEENSSVSDYEESKS